MIRVLQIKCRCTGEKERFDSLLQGSFSIGRDDKKVVLIHKPQMNSIGLILTFATFFVFANWAITGIRSMHVLIVSYWYLSNWTHATVVHWCIAIQLNVVADVIIRWCFGSTSSHPRLAFLPNGWDVLDYSRNCAMRQVVFCVVSQTMKNRNLSWIAWGRFLVK